jgi:uncharacterized glyoxalase superfamily protein PhnB
MKLIELTPMIWTEQIKETIDFYTHMLGFTCYEYNEEWGWASLGKDKVGIMLTKPNAHTPFDKPNFTGSFYFNTEDVDSLWNILKDKTNVCYPIDNFEHGMREFAIYDNNGYLLQFGKEIEP